LREEFKIKIEKYQTEGRAIVDMAESGFAHESTSAHGYAKIGERCFGQLDWGAKGCTNVIGALLNGLLVTVALFALNVDTDVFYAWLTQDLLPKISAGTVIVMDNASFHKRTDITQAIEFKGCILEFLPTYSPDLNPIEHTWAQLKSIRHHIRCSVDDLFSESVVGHLFMPL
jgi:transposase